MSKEIKLTKGVVAIVDDDDFEELSKYKWCCADGYAFRTEKRKSVYMHRQLMGFPKGLLVDHINRNRADNRRKNLRVVDWIDHARNTSPVRNKRFIGIDNIAKFNEGHTVKKPWRARIGHKYIGYFETEVEAAIAYNKEAERLGYVSRNII